jgi:hypothetical protein
MPPFEIGDTVYYTNPYGYVHKEACTIVSFYTSDDGLTPRALIIGQNTHVITNLTNLELNQYEMSTL